MKVNDISAEILKNDIGPFADRYFKKVVINSRNTYFRNTMKHRKYGIEFVAFDKCANDEMRVEEKGYDLAINPSLEVKQFRVPLESQVLLSAFYQLTDIQQQVILYNVIFKIPVRKIAQKFNVSQRMIEKHKANALKKLKRGICNDE